jgi:hypothetical protein
VFRFLIFRERTRFFKNRILVGTFLFLLVAFLTTSQESIIKSFENKKSAMLKQILSDKKWIYYPKNPRVVPTLLLASSSQPPVPLSLLFRPSVAFLGFINSSPSIFLLEAASPLPRFHFLAPTSPHPGSRSPVTLSREKLSS